METTPLPRFLIAGKLNRDYLLLPNGSSYVDIPGGNLLYAAAGLRIWEKSAGLIARVGEDYPRDWLEQISQNNLDLKGIRILPNAVDLRRFIAYPELETPQFDQPVSHYARLGLSFPKSLLGYTIPTNLLDNRSRLSELTIRRGDIPEVYLDASAAHLCPMDFLSHSILTSILRQGHISTLTLDPSDTYMDSIFWEDLPALLNGVTALLVSEQKLLRFFHGRITDLWEMAETIHSFGCEIVVIKRGVQGQYLYENASKSRWVIPSYPSNTIDLTGAGDAFCGGFLAGFRQNYDALEATLYGNISASLIAGGSGPFYALDTLPGLANRRLDALRNMVRKV